MHNKKLKFEGTPLYASLYTFEGWSQGKRDDMEMVAYSLLVLKNGNNPFFSTEENLNEVE